MKRLVPFLVALVGVLPFLPALGAGFVNWDDEAMLVRNLDFRGLDLARLRWMLTTTFFGHYSPIAWLSFGLNYVLGGLDPWGYHLANLLLHACNAGLFAVVASRLLGAPLAGADAGTISGRTAVEWGSAGAISGRTAAKGGSAGAISGPPHMVNARARVPSSAVLSGAATAALLFAVHPLRVESVAWVSERRDVLCGLFYLLAVWAYLRGVAGGGAIVSRWWSLSVAAFVAAVLSKAIAVTLPLSLLVLDVYPLRRHALGWRTLVREKLPYAVLGAAAAALALLIRHGGGDITDYERYGPGARLAMTGYGLWFYPWKLVWPTGLSPMYELPLRLDPWQWRFLGPGLAVVAVTIALHLLRRRWPGALAAWLHSAIVVLPVSGLVHSGSQLVHDRYSYLSGLGFALLAGGMVAAGVRRWMAGRSRVGMAALASSAALALLLGLGVATWAQTTLWRDSATLWSHAVALDRSCSVCWSNLGRALLAKGRIAEAEAHVTRAIGLRPDRPGPIENMGVIMLARGRHADAEAYFRRLVAERPGYGPYRNNLGVALANQGRNQEAENEFREAQRLATGLLDAHANLGMLYLRQGRYAEAIAPLRRARAMDPTHAGARGGLASALRHRAVELVQQGQLDEAARLWQEGSRMAPDDGELLSALGRALVEKGKGREALPALERAVALDPRRPEARFWLARAYRLAGKAAEADREVAALRDLAPALAADLISGSRPR